MQNSEFKFDSFFGQKIDNSILELDKIASPSSFDENSLKEGACLFTYKGNHELTLGKLINDGTEGRVYRVTGEELAVKIYKPRARTELKRKKLEKMIELDCLKKSIAWPIDIVTYNGEFVGFVMTLIEGKSLMSLTQNPIRIKRSYKSFDRLIEVNMIIELLNAFKYLHQINVLVGDVSLKNVNFDKKTYDITLVDIDGAQLDRFPCVSTTDGYDAEEVIKASYKERGVAPVSQELANYYRSYYRTEEMEQFAVSVLLYRFLMNGYKPYDYRDFGKFGYEYNDNELCAGLSFPYSETASRVKTDACEKALWSHLPSFLKTAFVNTFQKGVRYTDNDWLRLFKRYKELLESGELLQADSEAFNFYPEKKIDYSYVKYEAMEPFTECALTLWQASGKILKSLDDDAFKGKGKFAHEIARALEDKPSYKIGRYSFDLVYNIGVLKAVKCKYVL